MLPRSLSCLASAHSRLVGRLIHSAVLAAILSLGAHGALAQGVYFSGVVSAVGSGLNEPFGVAVDAAGDVFVADYANSAVKEILADANGQVSSTSTVNIVGSGFNDPWGVAVDPHGNVFVADTFNNAVKEIVAGTGTGDAAGQVSSNSQVLQVGMGGGFSLPASVALDAAGDVFVADFSNHAVKEIVAVSGQVLASSQVNTVGSGFNSPFSVAVDAAGDVFVADSFTGKVQEIVAGTGAGTPAGQVSSTSTVNTLASGFNTPQGVAVDAAGDVFVADTLNHEVKEMLAVNGQIPSTPTIIPVGNGITQPNGVAVDAAGRVFVGDFTKSTVTEVKPGTANLGTVNVGSFSSTVLIPFTFTSSVTLTSLGTYTQGAPGKDFTGGGPSTTCTLTSYVAGNTCLIAVQFSPQFAGLRTGVVQLVAGGSVVARALLRGIGSAPQVVFPSNPTVNTVNSGFNSPFSVALDAAGDVFVADFGNQAVKEILAGTGGNAAGQVSSSSVVVAEGSGFAGPGNVTVDASGDVFVTDVVVKEIVAVNGQVSPSLQVNTVGSGFNTPFGVAVDAAGNVFVADYGNQLVKEIVAGTGGNAAGQVSSTSQINTVGSGFNTPYGVAVDVAGDVFVTGLGSHAVKEIVAGTGGNAAGQVSSASTVITVGSGFNVPYSVAVDAAGNVFVADYGSKAINEIVAGTGGNVAGQVSSTSQVNAVAGGFNAPAGVAVDAAGNVFVGDLGNGKVDEIPLATPPSLTFPTATFAGTTDTADGPLSVTVANNGNAPLTFPLPADPAAFNPSVSANFAWDNSSTCDQNGAGAATAFTLAPGPSCTVAIDFEPTAVGSISGGVVLTDNALNAQSPAYATQTIALSGTGTINPTTTLAANVSTTYSPSGQDVTLSATVTPSGGATVNNGTVTFQAVSNGSQIFSSSPLQVNNGSAGTIVTLASSITPGTYSIQASYSGSAEFTSSSDSTHTLTITQIPQTIAFTLASPVSYSPTPITLSATGGASGNAVTFSIISGSAFGSLSGTNNSTLIITAPGTIVIAANQAGNTNYSAASQVTQTIVVNQIAQTIAFTPPSSPVTYGVAPITLSATGGASGNAVTFSIVSGSAYGSLSGLDNSALTVTGAGSIVIAANQLGNTDYSAAAQMTQTIVVSSAAQAITFAPPASPVTFGVAPISLSATGGASGNPVTFSIVSGSAFGSLSGLNNSTLTTSGPGTIVIAANQTGSAGYSVAPQVTKTIVVTQAVPAVTLISSANPALVQNTVTLTALVFSSVKLPGGTFTFTDTTTGTTLASAVALTATGAAYEAAASASVSTLAAGSHSIVAAYSGDPNFLSETTAPVAEQVDDFGLSFSGSGSVTSQTVNPGATATFTFNAAPSGSSTFPAAIAFGLNGLPSGATYTISPSTLAAGSGSTTVTLTVNVPTTAAAGKPADPFGRTAAPFALALFLLPFSRRVRKQARKLGRFTLPLFFLFAIAATMCSLSGCGGSGSSSGSGSGGSGSGGTSQTPQTYTLTITATAGALTHSGNLTLIVE